MNAFRRFFGRDDGESGQAVVLFAIMMLALLFAVGLAIDAGQLYSAKRAQQEAADAAAFAGAVVLYQQGTVDQAVAAARTDALTNGYAIMALDRGNTCGAFNTQSNGSVQLYGGGILVNSTCASFAAQNAQGTAGPCANNCFYVQSPYPLDVNGNATGHWADLGNTVTAK